MKRAQPSSRVHLPILLGAFMMTISQCSQEETPEAPSAAHASRSGDYRTLGTAEYEDKVAGGWIGQAVGVVFGGPTEFLWPGEIVPFDLDGFYQLKPELYMEEAQPFLEEQDWEAFQAVKARYKNEKENWETYTPTQMPAQDDLYIEFLFLHSLSEYGLDVSSRQMAEDWLSYLDPQHIWGANKAAYLNFQMGIWPPASGHPDNSSLGNAIDFQIESDLFGLISPGMPNASNALSDKVGHLMNYGDGVYAGMAISAMYGEAFFESDPRKLVEYSLTVIPEASGYAEMVRDVIAAHDAQPGDWQAAWRTVFAKWGKNLGLDVRTNGACVYLGLLYGDGDFWRTMNVSMRCGLDSDCNPSSSAGIIGTALGLSGIPDRWTILRNLPIDNSSFSGGAVVKDIYPNPINWDDIISATVYLGRRNVEASGGKVEGDVIHIPYQEPSTPPLEQVPE